jgi:hypothetical protein
MNVGVRESQYRGCTKLTYDVFLRSFPCFAIIYAQKKGEKKCVAQLYCIYKYVDADFNVTPFSLPTRHLAVLHKLHCCGKSTARRHMHQAELLFISFF